METVRESKVRYVQITAWEIASWIVCVFVFSLWNWIATKSVSPEGIAFFSVLSFFSWWAGRMIAESLMEGVSRIADFHLFFLLGFFFVNTMVYLLFLILPLSIAVDFGLACLTVFFVGTLKYRASSIRILKFLTADGACRPSSRYVWFCWRPLCGRSLP